MITCITNKTTRVISMRSAGRVGIIRRDKKSGPYFVTLSFIKSRILSPFDMCWMLGCIVDDQKWQQKILRRVHFLQFFRQDILVKVCEIAKILCISGKRWNSKIQMLKAVLSLSMNYFPHRIFFHWIWIFMHLTYI